jgi:hypothetical protein
MDNSRRSIDRRVGKVMLFGGTSLSALLMSATAAQAQCAPDPAPAFGVVTCTGTDSDGLVVNNSLTAVNIDADATVNNAVPDGIAIRATSALPGADPFFNYSRINVNGVVDGSSVGIQVDMGTVAPGFFQPPLISSDITVGETGSIAGTVGISLVGNDANPSFFATTAYLTNDGVISGSGIAIEAINPAQAYFQVINNSATGRIGGIRAFTSFLNNQGLIDGGTAPAYSYVIAPNVVGQGLLTNSGTITSGNTTGTIIFPPSPFSQSANVTNSGSIANTGAGAAIVADQLFLQNDATGTIIAETTAISATRSIQLTNRGTINGAVISSASEPFDSSIIDTVGGTITGGLTLGAGNDTVIVNYGTALNPIGGIAGAIDAGGGFDRLKLNIAVSTELSGGVAIPASFEEIGFSIASGQTLTLAQDFIAASQVSVTGPLGGAHAELINRASLSLTGTALSVSGLVDTVNSGTVSGTNLGLALNGVSSFANTGSISSVNGGGAQLDFTGNASNSGSIVAGNTALSLNFGGFTNSGEIRSTQGTGVEIREMSGQTFYNSGVISGNLTGIRLYSTQSDRIINTGTISALSGPGISLLWTGIVDNRAGGVISGGGIAISGGGNNATVFNAGTINGNVNLNNTQGVPNVFVARAGGILNGDLNFGYGNGVFVTSLTGSGQNPLPGVSGEISGSGILTLRYLVDQNASVVLTPPVGAFDSIGYELSNNAVLMATTQSLQTASIDFSGQGSVDLTADISSLGPMWTVLVGGGSLANPSAAPTGVDLISHGTLTRTRDPLASIISPVANVIVISGSTFTNQGAIIVNDPTPMPFDGPAIAGISGGGAIINNGMISLNGGLGISGSNIVNAGTIAQAAGGADARGVSVAGTFINTGSIVTGGAALGLGTFFNPNGQSGPTVVANSGIIQSTNGAAIVEQDIFTGNLRRVINQTTGIISGAPGQDAIQMNGFAEIDNAGTINGNVNLAFSGPPYFFNWSLPNTYISRGGTLNGNLTFGSGNDAFIATGNGTGVTGAIEAGAGLDTFIQGYTVSSTVSPTGTIPGSFERYGVGALGPDVTLTVNAGPAPFGTGLIFYGDGAIINKADVATSGPFNPPNQVLLGLFSIGVPKDALAFTNEGVLADGVSGIVRSFTNTGTIGSTAFTGTPVQLTVPTTANFVFSNSGTIQNYASYYFTPAIAISQQSASLDSATIENSGMIGGGIVANLNVTDFHFSNSGTITAYGDQQFNNPSVQLSSNFNWDDFGFLLPIENSVTVDNSGIIQ